MPSGSYGYMGTATTSLIGGSTASSLPALAKMWTRRWTRAATACPEVEQEAVAMEFNEHRAGAHRRWPKKSLMLLATYWAVAGSISGKNGIAMMDLETWSVTGNSNSLE